MGILSNAVSSAVSTITSSGGSSIKGQISSSASKLFTGKFDVNNLKKINSGGNEYIQFPSDLLGRKDISQYTYLSCKDHKFDWKGTSKKTNLGAIYLPLPKELNANYKSNWTSADGGALGRSAGQSAIRALKTGNIASDALGMGAIEQTAEYRVGKKLLDMGGGVADKLGGEGGRTAMEHALGQVVNPMKLLNWNAPDFRTFSFSWELMPMSGSESDDLNQIIYWLKRYIHTPSNRQAVTLDYPPLWDIHFVDAYAAKGVGNKYLFTTKECAITDISVDYTAKGKAFHRVGKDGKGFHAPNGVTLSISFSETTILTQEDFGTTYPTDKPTP